MGLDNIISYSKPKSVVSESYRALRTNLEFSLSADSSKIVLVTSSHVGEGKSSISANLATVFAMQGKKTVLIDADMRRGIQHKNFNLTNKVGLSNFLANQEVEEEKLIKKTEIQKLYVITCGVVPPNPSELLSLPKMDELLEELRNEFDIIIIDGAPILPVTDSVILSSKVDRVIIVAASKETHKDELKQVKFSLENAGAKIAGVVLNKLNVKIGKYSNYKSGYYGYYYSGYYGNDENQKSHHSSSKKEK